MKTNRQKRSNYKAFAEIFGTHAVYAALQNTNRIHQKLFVSQNQRENLDKNIGKLVPEINELHSKEMLKSDIIVMLDQVTDPHNIGSIMRSCSLFNCNSIIVSNDNAPDITATMAKAASGALEVINYISVVNLSRAIIQFKKNNYWIYGLDSNEKMKNKNLDLPSRCVLVFGSEGKGLRNLTKKECDELVSIPIKKNDDYNIDSLNVANACSITLYEHFKNFN